MSYLNGLLSSNKDISSSHSVGIVGVGFKLTSDGIMIWILKK